MAQEEGCQVHRRVQQGTDPIGLVECNRLQVGDAIVVMMRHDQRCCIRSAAGNPDASRLVLLLPRRRDNSNVAGDQSCSGLW